jgi:hypothetical protein
VGFFTPFFGGSLAMGVSDLILDRGCLVERPRLHVRVLRRSVTNSVAFCRFCHLGFLTCMRCESSLGLCWTMRGFQEKRKVSSPGIQSKQPRLLLSLCASCGSHASVVYLEPYSYRSTARWTYARSMCVFVQRSCAIFGDRVG